MTERAPSLRVTAWRELGRNAGPPSLCYPLFAVACAVSTEYGSAYPDLAVFFIASLTVVAVLRAWSGRAVSQDPTPAMERVLVWTTLLCAGLWSLYTCSALLLFPPGWTTEMMAVMSVGLSAGGVASLGPDLALLRGFVILQLLAPGLVLCGRHDRESTMAVAVFLYGVFLLQIGRRQYKFYWRALEDNELLRLRSLELEQAKRETEQLSERTQSILDSAGDGIVGVDDQGVTTFVNPAVARMTGQPTAALVGRSLWTWLRYEGEGVSPQACIEEVCSQGGTCRCSGAIVVREDGTRLVVDVVASSIRAEGRLVGAVLSLADVTERHALERLKDQFVSTVSHELRTPLTSIRGSLGMLASGQLDRNVEASRRMLEIASANTERLVRLINDVLDLQKMRQSGLELKRKPCNAGVLMTTAEDSVATLARKSGVTLEVQAVDCEISGDPDRLVQALINLLSNALKFCEAGGAVRLTAVVGESEIEFCVADDGIGIPEDKQEKIFDDFFQVDGSDSRSRGGTGLGLAICRRIVEAHGGRLRVQSAPPERGSRFYITLPRVAPAGPLSST